MWAFSSTFLRLSTYCASVGPGLWPQRRAARRLPVPGVRGTGRSLGLVVYMVARLHSAPWGPSALLPSAAAPGGRLLSEASLSQSPLHPARLSPLSHTHTPLRLCEVLPACTKFIRGGQPHLRNQGSERVTWHSRRGRPPWRRPLCVAPGTGSCCNFCESLRPPQARAPFTPERTGGLEPVCVRVSLFL